MYQPTRVLNKVLASGVAGAVVTLIVWALNTYAGANVPDYVAGAMVTIVSAVIAWLVPLAPGEVAPVDLEPHPVTTPPEPDA